MTIPDAAAVKAMFGRIARRYDAANRVLSLGRDIGWRRRLVTAAAARRPQALLDLATGSGDVAFALGRAFPPPASVVGMDFCAPMLVQAERKRQAAGPGAFPHLRFAEGDALALPLPDASFDVVTIAFGLRNLADRPRGLREMRRVLRPGGALLILEFSQPDRWLRPFYFFYLRRMLPRLGGWMTGDPSAYRYLNATIEEFPARPALERELREAGFASVSSRGLTGGTVALHEGVA